MRNVALLVFCWIACALGPAGAHALLDHSQPAEGSTVAASPAQVVLWFTERIEPDFSRVEVSDASGARLDKGDSRGDRSDPTTLLVSVAKLPPGTYRVHWKVLTADTHTAEGEFRFRVAAQ